MHANTSPVSTSTTPSIPKAASVFVSSTGGPVSATTFGFELLPVLEAEAARASAVVDGRETVEVTFIGIDCDEIRTRFVEVAAALEADKKELDESRDTGVELEVTCCVSTPGARQLRRPAIARPLSATILGSLSNPELRTDDS